MKIQGATDGRVHLAMWSHSTLRDDLPGEVVPLESDGVLPSSSNPAA